MACKRDKDLSLCFARAKVKIDGGPYFYTIYVWETIEALNACSLDHSDEDGEAIGLCCHMPFRLVFSDGCEKEIHAPKLGELHFVKDRWSLEIVAHECRHTEISAFRALKIQPVADSWQNYEDEERACDYLGKLVDAVYRWLWEVNPHGKHA